MTGSVLRFPTARRIQDEALEELELLLCASPDRQDDEPILTNDLGCNAWELLDLMRSTFCSFVMTANGSPMSARGHVLATFDADRITTAWTSVRAGVASLRGCCQDDPMVWPGAELFAFVTAALGAVRR